jgi:integrase
VQHAADELGDLVRWDGFEVGVRGAAALLGGLAHGRSVRRSAGGGKAARVVYLQAAKIDRAELFETNKSRQRIRMHDLRATFITVSLANGKSETWVADSTGHKSSIMINRYRRAARTFAETGLRASLHGRRDPGAHFPRDGIGRRIGRRWW